MIQAPVIQIVIIKQTDDILIVKPPVDEIKVVE